VSAKRGERILGPYEQSNGWRVVVVHVDGSRESRILETEAKATRCIELLTAELASEDHTTTTALTEYKRHLTDKGNKQASIDVTEWALGQFFPEPMPLRLLTAKRCAALYEALRTRPCERTGQPMAADTHRNVLAQAKSFLAWCVKRRWIGENPCADVEGIGKRRPRGKSLGKAGNELRVKQARAWYVTALGLATKGDHGAIGGLVALLLGMRASEIVSRRVADLDDDTAPGDLLWIPCAKTAAGRRTIEVPDVLRPLLLACAAGKAPERHLFECERTPHELAHPKPHGRDWVIAQVHRVCDLAQVPLVTAHAMRGLLATLTAERGMAGHLIAATLGHEDERTTMTAYAAPGSAATGVNRRGLGVLNGGVQSPTKVAK
jgi:integrase